MFGPVAGPDLAALRAAFDVDRIDRSEPVAVEQLASIARDAAQRYGAQVAEFGKSPLGPRAVRIFLVYRPGQTTPVDVRVEGSLGSALGAGAWSTLVDRAIALALAKLGVTVDTSSAQPAATVDYFQKAELALTMAETLGIIKPADYARYETLLGDVRAITTDAAHPDERLAADVAKFLGDLGVTNVDLHAADQFLAFVHNVKGGQSAIIKSATLFGVRGAYEFVPAASDQGKSEGLS